VALILAMCEEGVSRVGKYHDSFENIKISIILKIS